MGGDVRLALAMGCLWATAAVGSDHIDGHETRRDRRADLTDLYAWTPAPGRLAVAVGWGPLTGKRARPETDHRVRLRLRRVDGAGAGVDELAIACVGERGKGREDALACEIGGNTHRIPWGEAVEVDGMRLFAGVRRDPFFIALGKANDAHPRHGHRRAVRGVDFLHNCVIRGHIAALVVELPAREVPGERPFVGVVAESEREGVQIDRLGRAELGNFVLAQRFGPKALQPEVPEPDVRAAFNAEDGFAMTAGHLPYYERAAELGLARLDRFDEGRDWPEPHPLLERLLDDWLVVDPSRACGVADPTFLEIEAAWLAGRPHQTCGGRTPDDDAVDRLLTWLINGPERVPPEAPLYGEPGRPAPARTDGVHRPGAPAAATFPYLREP